MATLKHQLHREEEDLVGHRGLLPASDHQTFKMLIPPKLRLIYRSLLSLNPNVSNFHITGFTKEGKNQLPNTDYGMQSYVTINRFLAAFIEHALKDLDYEVREKSFVEALLDIELCDVKNNGTLYNDNGHSFDNVLYYGNEFRLFTFDLVLFSFVEILSQDFLLAAVITVLFDE
ncbi:meckelin, partial [Halyomorpha halys]|uniref:meckelin n=1 Tax=Halyomorpha halys TaxID=286706 RepID=UPI0034D1824B